MKHPPFPLDVGLVDIHHPQAAIRDLARRDPRRDHSHADAEFGHFLDRLHVTEHQRLLPMAALLLQPLLDQPVGLGRAGVDDELMVIDRREHR